MDTRDDLVADLAATDARECSQFLAQAEAAVLATLNRLSVPNGGPRFTRWLAISALLRPASHLMVAGLEESAQDYDRYVAMVQELAERLSPWAPHTGRTH